MRTHATSCIWETSLQNCQKTKESLENIGIFLLLKSNFPHTKFDFLQRLSAFFNGFPLSSMVFWFSSMAFQFSSTAFHFTRNPRKSIYGEKYTKDHYLSFVFFATCSPTRSPSFVIPTTIPNMSHIWQSQFQRGIVQEIIQQFGPTQIVLFEPPGEIGTPERRVPAIKQSIEELKHLTYFTDFIIVHGVQCSQCCNLWGC